MLKGSPERRYKSILPLKSTDDQALLGSSQQAQGKRTNRRCCRQNRCRQLTDYLSGCLGRVAGCVPECVSAAGSWLATPFKPSTYQQSRRDKCLFNPTKPSLLSEMPSYDNRWRLALQQLLHVGVEIALFWGVEKSIVWLFDCGGAIGDDALHCGGNIGEIKDVGRFGLAVFALITALCRYKRIQRVRGLQEQVILLDQIIQSAGEFVQEAQFLGNYKDAEKVGFGMRLQSTRLFVSQGDGVGLKQLLSNLRTDEKAWHGHHQKCARIIHKGLRSLLVVPGSISVSVWGTIMLVTVDENPATGWDGREPIKHMSAVQYVLIALGTAAALYLKWQDDLTTATTRLKQIRSGLLDQVGRQRDALAVFNVTDAVDAGAHRSESSDSIVCV